MPNPKLSILQERLTHALAPETLEIRDD
ncbi:MAG: hypothetical protein RL597_740, partial [Pseudomonadota bacterium]